jgi:hypothetical protein
MGFRIFGFLTEKGWPGVTDAFYFVMIGVIVLMGFAVYKMVYQAYIKDPKPENINPAIQIIKICFIITIIYILLIN